MDTLATTLIQTLGGTTAVSRMTFAPISTVQSWKKNGIPGSRLAHLRLVAEREGKAIDWETGCLVASDGDAADHDVVDTTVTDATSSGKTGEVSATQVAA